MGGNGRGRGEQVQPRFPPTTPLPHPHPLPHSLTPLTPTHSHPTHPSPPPPQLFPDHTAHSLPHPHSPHPPPPPTQLSPDHTAAWDLLQRRAVLDRELREVRARIAARMSDPAHCLKFLKPGRVVRVAKGEEDYGWGVVLLVMEPKRKGATGTATGSATGTPFKARDYVVDVLLECAPEEVSPVPRPPRGGEAATLRTVPVRLPLVVCISKVREMGGCGVWGVHVRLPLVVCLSKARGEGVWGVGCASKATAGRGTISWPLAFHPSLKQHSNLTTLVPTPPVSRDFAQRLEVPHCVGRGDAHHPAAGAEQGGGGQGAEAGAGGRVWVQGRGGEGCGGVRV